MRWRRLRDDDRGIVIIFFALVLTLLLIFGAFALDLGLVYNARRQDQSAADTAALAGVQEEDADDILSQVDDKASDTLGVNQNTIDWTDCTLADNDSVDTPIVVSSVTYNCITTNSFGSVQVKLPERTVDAVFGRVVGKNDYAHSAFAIAGIQRVGLGSVLPFGLPASSSGENAACLKDGPHSEAPCDGPDSGNFGYLDFTRYGNASLGTNQLCSGQVNERLSENIAVGIDHDLRTYPDPLAGRIVDNNDCGALERKPTSVFVETGNKTSAFGNGIYSGSGFRGQPARLAQSSPDLPWGTRETAITPYNLDDNPLWQFIEPIDGDGDGTIEVPDSCQKGPFLEVLGGTYTSLPETPANVRAYISGRSTSEEEMRLMIDRCITHYRGLPWDANGAITGGGEPSSCGTGCVDPVFARQDNNSADGELYDIQLTSRFGYVPSLTTSFGTPAQTPNVYDFQTFRAVFLQRLVGGCNSSGSSCDLDFEPNPSAPRGSSAPNIGSAEAITAWLFPPKMLPNNLGDEGAPFALGTNRVVRLTR